VPFNILSDDIHKNEYSYLSTCLL